MTDFHLIIPARYESSRLACKVLVDIAGKPMLQRVFERAQQSGAKSIVIATDHEEIQAVAENFGARVCMTAQKHRSGTERIAEVLTQYDYRDDDIIINLQADEPLMPVALLEQVAGNLAGNEEAHAASLVTLIEDKADIFNPNIVKAVMDAKGFALYFSRAPIPWQQQGMSVDNAAQLAGQYYRHIGLYAYRSDFIHRYVALPPCELENIERLEQLRILHQGYRLHLNIAHEVPPVGVDTAEDLANIRKIFELEGL